MHDGQSLLDVGCCFGQDIRKLVADGAPAGNLIGTDLHQEFLDLGYELFRDRETLTSRFFAGNILADEKSYESLDGKLDIIHVASFFHLFSLPTQIQIAKRLVKLLRPVSGSLILGRQTGNLNPGDYTHGDKAQKGMWRHDVHSWEEMWATVGRETGTEWRVEASLAGTYGFIKSERAGTGWRDKGDRGLRFEIWRV